MDARRPPRRLPREYLEIWSALEEADRIATSRRDLARRLGVSTFTLQRILVDGDVPRLSRAVSTRVLHAWIRTLTRLACFFGKEPRRWIELAGAHWSPATAEVSRRVERELGRSRQPSVGAASPAPAAADSAAGAPVSSGLSAGTVEIGLAADSPLDVPVGDGSTTFLREFARRLILGVDPSLQPVFRVYPEGELLRALTHPGTPLAFGVGVAATAARRRRGLAFLSLPGWRLHLGGLRLLAGRAAPSGSGAPAAGDAARPGPLGMDWEEVTDPAGAARLIVRAQSPAHDFLAGACGIPPARLVVLESDEHHGSPAPAASERTARIASALLRESETSDQRPVFLVDDVGTCREVSRWIEAGGESGWHGQELRPSDAAARSYPLAIAVPAAASSGRRLLRAARDRELFGAASEETARLYADLLLAVSRRRLEDLGVRLETFRQAGRGFRAALFRSLLTAPPDATDPDRPAGPEDPYSPGGDILRPAGEAPPETKDAGLLRAPGKPRAAGPCSLETIESRRRLVPAAWHDTFDAAARRFTQHPTAWLCGSCAASLREAHNRGASDQYCRHCSDEQGRLRPRDEVRLILARWLRGWQGEMPPEEAARRADAYMKAMPAWSRN